MLTSYLTKLDENYVNTKNEQNSPVQRKRFSSPRFQAQSDIQYKDKLKIKTEKFAQLRKEREQLEKEIKNLSQGETFILKTRKEEIKNIIIPNLESLIKSKIDYDNLLWGMKSSNRTVAAGEGKRIDRAERQKEINDIKDRKILFESVLNDVTKNIDKQELAEFRLERQNITFKEQVNSGDFNETPSTTMEIIKPITDSIIKPITDSIIEEPKKNILGLSLIPLGIIGLLLYSRSVRK